MDKKLKKFVDVEVKAAEGDERSLWFTASTEDRDRDGDILSVRGWKLQHYKKNPVFLWAHDYSRPPIGKGVEVDNTDGKLRIKMEFVPADIDPFAEQIYQLYKQGFMRTVSVGFIPYKSEDLSEEDKKQRPELTWGRRMSAELLELSAVPVPANPMALAQREFGEALAKGYGINQAQEETESPLLPYRDADGKINPLMLKASMGALLGARGGVLLSESALKACYGRLSRLLRETGATPPVLKSYSQDELKEMFKDVWHGELLDIVTAAKDVEDKMAEDEAKKQAELEAVGHLIGSINETAQIVAKLAQAIK